MGRARKAAIWLATRSVVVLLGGALHAHIMIWLCDDDRPDALIDLILFLPDRMWRQVTSRGYPFSYPLPIPALACMVFYGVLYAFLVFGVLRWLKTRFWESDEPRIVTKRTAQYMIYLLSAGTCLALVTAYYSCVNAWAAGLVWAAIGSLVSLGYHGQDRRARMTVRGALRLTKRADMVYIALLLLNACAAFLAEALLGKLVGG